MKYFLSIIAIFKNESMILEEWIKHHIDEGVEHFYLINHNSDDDFLKIIKKYQSYITLTSDTYTQEEHVLNYLINKHYLNLIKKESEWVILCDIDEYFYNKHNYKNIVHFLKNTGEISNNIGTIWTPWKLFYAAKTDKIESSIIKELLYRRPVVKINDYGCGKSIYRTRDLNQLSIHHGSNPYNYVLNREILNKRKDQNNNDTLILNENSNICCNHYRFISKDYYNKVKCIRKGQKSKQNHIYTMEYFNTINSEKQQLKDIVLYDKKYKITNFVQTYINIDNIVSESKKSYLKYNKFKYNFYNDEECRTFIKTNFNIDVLNTYDKIIPGAFKADLFRYCYLFKKGGIYSDIDTICLDNLDKLINTNYDIVLVKERTNIPGIFQAFIISKPGQKLFMNAINKIIYNVKNNYYGEKNQNKITNILSITGPVLLGNVLCNMLNIPEFTINNKYHTDIILNNCYIKIIDFTNDGFITFDDIKLIKVKNNKYKPNDDYKELFLNKKIYIESNL